MGSEMCIRDRDLYVQFVWDRTRRPIHRQKEEIITFPTRYRSSSADFIHSNSDPKTTQKWVAKQYFYPYTCTVPVLKTNTSAELFCEAAHPSQLIHFSSLPCTTIHQSKALGLSITTVYGTSSAELIQHQFGSTTVHSQLTVTGGV